MAIQWAAIDYLRHAVREIYINGLRVPAPEIQAGEVYQCEYMHDMFVFQMVWPDMRTLNDSSGWTVYCRFGAENRQGFFYGYVQSSTIVEVRANAATNIRTVQFTCLGATSTMQSGQPRSFPGMSADNVAKQLLTPYRLALVADHHDFMWQTLVQSRETDWQFLGKLARSIGYVLTSSKVTVFFIDPVKVVLNTGNAIGIFSAEDTPNNSNLVSGGVSVGAKANVTGFTNTVVNGLDPTGAQTFGSGDNDPRLSYLGAFPVSPTTQRFDPSMTPYDAKHAQVIAGSNNRPEKWPLQSQLFCKGDGRLRPGILAAVHVGQNQVSGLWLTRSVVHQLGRNGYTMDVCLARDATTNSPYPTPTITAGDRSGPLNAVAAPVVTNGRWASVWSA